ncbi:oligopeptidase A [Caulobacter radicis]|uniref:M3 family metallopeptidase n=1 Tax=Caulobacter radicis TaxID=2172650 RepID=UPI000D57C063|nr:M3 family metallopeptidase [Caulobacter radicis]PVM84543.1 oligopeptidase A [Caulobacter radicis]
MSNTLLDPFTLPCFTALTPQAIDAALTEGLTRYEAVVADLVKARASSFDALWIPLERVEAQLDALWSAVSHLNAMHSDPSLREAYAAGEARLVNATTKVRQNVELFGLLKTLHAGDDMARRPQADRAAVKSLVREFELAGVGLPEERRTRFAALTAEASQLSIDFSNALLDATDAWSEHVTQAEDLAGVPAASLAMFAGAAKEKGLEGWLVTLQYPSVSAVLTFCENRALRERVYSAFGTRASDQGPHAGQFDNSGRIARILEIRKELAALLGFENAASWSLATKMASDPQEVLDFLRDLGLRARPAAEQDRREMEAFAAEVLGLSDLQPWDNGFVSERMRVARFAVEEQTVRAYFPVEQVLGGWRALLGDLYGLSLVERTGVDLWSPDAAYYDVTDDQGRLLAGLYTDLHARPGKRGGAWMAPARPRLNDDTGSRLPVAYLVCNFAAKQRDQPTLLSHGDIITLLHETGHCLHHLFTQVDRPNIAGVMGFEWDAVELPSQVMEDFAWEHRLLQRMSRHVESGEPLPDSLFQKMLKARSFQAGLALVRQLEFSLFDMLLHQGQEGDDPMAVLELARKEVAVSTPPAWHRFPHGFSHIFAGGYAAGYYSYLWAEVLAADGFQKFVEAGLTDRATAELFRREVLAHGASRPAADSFRAFRGRDPDPAALLTRRGLAA